MISYPAKKTVIDIFNGALASVDPYKLTKDRLSSIEYSFIKGGYTKLLLVAFGKASYPMTKAFIDGLPRLVDRGIVITKYDHIPKKGPGGIDNHGLSPKIEVFEAGHPLPDENGVNATAKVISLLEVADEKTFIVCLISGGGSALLVSPCETVKLREKQEATSLLLNAGAAIEELNAVRKHLSRIKGGRLAGIAGSSKIASLILSDVIGDPLHVIASGPTSPDETTFRDALKVIDKYGLTVAMPPPIMNVLREGLAGKISETPKKENPFFHNVENIIIGSNRMAMETARTSAQKVGLDVILQSRYVQGEAREVSRKMALDALAKRGSMKRGGSTETKRGQLCIISGGETTVTVKGHGIGGRNMELALAFAIEIEGTTGITLLSAGTDGTDGPTDAAGAVVDGKTISLARQKGLAPEGYLENNDSYTFFKETGDLLFTGPTGTNVMDIQIVLMDL